MRPNLIVVVFDTLRYDAVFGGLADMPNLRRFAEQSVVFDNAWGEGLPTIPFRRALFTGMRSFPWRYKGPQRGVFPHRLGWHAVPDDQTTVPEYLYAHGYATQLVSDVWHMFKPTMNFTRGFIGWDAIRGQEGDTHRLGAPSLGRADTLDPTRVGPPAYLYQVKDRRTEDDYFVAKVFDRASQFITDIGSAAPYCLWVESFSPHEFWDPPMRFAEAYAPANGPDQIVPSTLNGTAPASADIERTRALYQGYCTFCDERFGRFIDTLEKSGTLQNSIVAVLSDHGTELWDNGRFGKSAARPYRYNTQINLMIRHPDGAGAGDRIDAFVQNQDIAPTLLSLVDIPHPRMDGDNLWPLIADPRAMNAVSERDHAVIGWSEYASVRDRAWNLVINTVDPTDDLRLFDLRSDSDEKINVADKHPDVIRSLAARLEALLGAPLPAVYQHQISQGPEATPGGLRSIRDQARQPGESWSESNLV